MLLTPDAVMPLFITLLCLAVVWCTSSVLQQFSPLELLLLEPGSSEKTLCFCIPN